jgi:hypothetical protein
MDKTLLKAYIRTVVEEEINKALPKLLEQTIADIKALKESTNSNKQENLPGKIDRKRLAEIMGVQYDGETLSATGNYIGTNVSSAQGPPEVVKAINKDYSAMMKKLNLT